MPRSLLALCLPSRAARSLNDVTIPDDALKPDLELGKRADDTAMELARWALLGIAGYGFLLKEMAVPNSAGLLACQRYALFLLGGASLLALAAACAIITKEATIRNFSLQLVIFRTLKKLENGGWSEPDKRDLEKDLDDFRSMQRRYVGISEWSLRFAHVSLAVGAIVTVICFGLVLYSMKANTTPAAIGSIAATTVAHGPASRN
jgi:hypothetical protein